MEIITNSPRVREARRTNVELILSQHHTNCLACVRNENCELKQVAGELILEADSIRMNMLRPDGLPRSSGAGCRQVH